MNTARRSVVRSRLPQVEPAMLTVTAGGGVAGFVLRRFDGYEAFDRGGRTLGKFKDQQSAIGAIRRRNGRAS
jgi:hypothetical protein